MLDRQLVEDIANRIRPGDEGLIEKDGHVVRAIGVLATLEHGDARPAFSGGTSLSIGWGLGPLPRGVSLRFQRDDLSVFPDVDRYAVHAGGSAGVLRRSAQGAPDLRGKLGFRFSGSLVLHPLVSSN